MAEQFEVRELLRRAEAIWYLGFTDTGQEDLYIYPKPGDGADLIAHIVFAPLDLAADDAEPLVPVRFHPAIVHYAAAEAFSTREDNFEAEATYRAKFDASLSELRGLRFSRAGRQPRQMRVQGIHF